jgi:small subunit ribosomal protein S20
MPITKRAIKKLRHDRARTKENAGQRALLKGLVKKARKAPTEKSVSVVFAALDKAAKRNIIHKNAASRTKARLAKLLKK